MGADWFAESTRWCPRIQQTNWIWRTIAIVDLTLTEVQRAFAGHSSYSIHLVTSKQWICNATKSVAMLIAALNLLTANIILGQYVCFIFNGLKHLRCPIGPVKTVRCYSQTEWILQISSHRSYWTMIWLNTFDFLSSSVSIAQFTSSCSDWQWVWQIHLWCTQ